MAVIWIFLLFLFNLFQNSLFNYVTNIIIWKVLLTYIFFLLITLIGIFLNKKLKLGEKIDNETRVYTPKEFISRSLYFFELIKIQFKHPLFINIKSNVCVLYLVFLPFQILCFCWEFINYLIIYKKCKKEKKPFIFEFEKKQNKNWKINIFITIFHTIPKAGAYNTIYNILKIYHNFDYTKNKK